MFEEAPRRGHAPERCVYQVIERTVTADGQILLLPFFEGAAYWMCLPAPPDNVLPWYLDHGTMEPCHSEGKTDMLRARNNLDVLNDRYRRNPPGFVWKGNARALRSRNCRRPKSSF